MGLLLDFAWAGETSAGHASMTSPPTTWRSLPASGGPRRPPVFAGARDYCKPLLEPLASRFAHNRAPTENVSAARKPACSACSEHARIAPSAARARSLDPRSHASPRQHPRCAAPAPLQCRAPHPPARPIVNHGVALLAIGRQHALNSALPPAAVRRPPSPRPAPGRRNCRSRRRPRKWAHALRGQAPPSPQSNGPVRKRHWGDHRHGHRGHRQN